jgi:hypothetical protein
MLDPRPQLTFYGRRGCSLCDEMRSALQALLEERVTRGLLIPSVRDVDVDGDAGLQARYGALVPVVQLGVSELPLVTSARQLSVFLDRSMPRLA